MNMASRDIRRMMIDAFFKIICYGLYLALIILLLVKLWIKIK
jgi:hypothetical protein